jgi:acetylglutamate kinase
MAGVSSARIKFKNATGRRVTTSAESEVSVAAALAYMQAKLKTQSGQAGNTTGSQSTGLDGTLAINQPGHTDAADGANLDIKDAAGNTRNIHVPQMSQSYKSSLNDGSIDITQADVLAIVSTYSTAVGSTWTLVSGRYTSEG